MRFLYSNPIKPEAIDKKGYLAYQKNIGLGFHKESKEKPCFLEIDDKKTTFN